MNQANKTFLNLLSIFIIEKLKTCMRGSTCSSNLALALCLVGLKAMKVPLWGNLFMPHALKTFGRLSLGRARA